MSPLMPKATAIWLIENTALTFEQISDFCDIHILEIQALADHDGPSPILGLDPIASSQLTLEEIKKCEEDSTRSLKLKEAPEYKISKKKVKYTPLAKRQDRPDAIAWIIKYYPHFTDNMIMKLLNTTKKTIETVRLKTHKNSINIKPKNPVLVGFCTQDELDRVVIQAEKYKK